MHPVPDEPMQTPLSRGPLGRALITGASRRVGRAIAVELAHAGFDLALTYRADRDGCEETARIAVDAARSAGMSVHADVAQLDLNAAAAVERFAQMAAAQPLDALIHNASTYRETPFGAITEADFAEMYRVEVVSPALLTQALAPALRRARLPIGGAVVFFSDIHALGRARPNFTPYLVAKAAVQSLAAQMAVELAPAVRVHCIAPGVIAWPDGFPEDAKPTILSRTPLARAGTPDEAAKLVRFLVLEASYLSGDTIRIDGGRALR
jgi:pteridine reductase